MYPWNNILSGVIVGKDGGFCSPNEDQSLQSFLNRIVITNYDETDWHVFLVSLIYVLQTHTCTVEVTEKADFQLYC